MQKGRLAAPSSFNSFPLYYQLTKKTLKNKSLQTEKDKRSMKNTMPNLKPIKARG